MTTDPQTAEERIARHLAAKDWLVEPGSAWARRGKKFREDYLTLAREVIAVAREDAPAAVSVPQPTRADGELRDRIRRAVCEAEGFAWDGDMLEPDEYGDVADAVLAVLPPPVDRAAVLNDAAQRLYTALFPAVYDDMGQKAAEGVNRAVSELRRMAAGAQQQPDTERPRCPHCQLPHDLTPSMALACASIRASIADRDAAVGPSRVAAEEQPAETQALDCNCLSGPKSKRHAPYCPMRQLPGTSGLRLADQERPVVGEQLDTQETRPCDGCGHREHPARECPVTLYGERCACDEPVAAEDPRP